MQGSAATDMRGGGSFNSTFFRDTVYMYEHACTLRVKLCKLPFVISAYMCEKSVPQIQLWCWQCVPYKCLYFYYFVYYANEIQISQSTIASDSFVVFLRNFCITATFPFSALLVGWQEGHPACKKLVVGLLVVMIWLEFCTSYSCSCHHHLHYP